MQRSPHIPIEIFCYLDYSHTLPALNNLIKRTTHLLTSLIRTTKFVKLPFAPKLNRMIDTYEAKFQKRSNYGIDDSYGVKYRKDLKKCTVLKNLNFHAAGIFAYFRTLFVD